jgi:hypothetical protein
MRPCPVCESPVSGWACEVCGKELGGVPGAAVPVAPLEGLELTELPGLPPERLAFAPAPDLEPTLLAAVPEIPGDPIPGWEPTEPSGGPDMPAGGLPEVDLGRETQHDAPTVVPAAATCRYCRNVQATGLFCDRCGMRLPRPLAPTAAVAAPRVERVLPPLLRAHAGRSPTLRGLRGAPAHRGLSPIAADAAPRRPLGFRD